MQNPIYLAYFLSNNIFKQNVQYQRFTILTILTDTWSELSSGTPTEIPFAVSPFSSWILMNNLPNFRHVCFSSLKNSSARNLKVHCSIQRALSVENLNMRKARNVIRTKMHCGNYVLCIRMAMMSCHQMEHFLLRRFFCSSPVLSIKMLFNSLFIFSWW